MVGIRGTPARNEIVEIPGGLAARTCAGRCGGWLAMATHPQQGLAQGSDDAAGQLTGRSECRSGLTLTGRPEPPTVP